MGFVLRAGRSQVNFPNVVVAVNKLTGTQYGSVMDVEGPVIYMKVTSGRSYHPINREYLQILRPDLVLPYNPRRVRGKQIIKEYQDKLAKTGVSLELKEELKELRYPPTITRRQCDQFIKGYVPVKAFIDYDSFLDDLLTFINRSNA